MKFATIVTLVAVASAADKKAAVKKSCGSVTVSSFSDATCKKATLKDKKAVVTTSDMSKIATIDKCIAVGKTWVKVHCDTTGMLTTVYTDKACTKKAKTGSKVAAWGVCTKGSAKQWLISKAADSLKMAVTGAALALVASQF